LRLCIGGGALCILCRSVHKAGCPGSGRETCRRGVAAGSGDPRRALGELRRTNCCGLPFFDFLKGEESVVARSQVMASERLALSGRVSRGTSLEGSWEVKEAPGRFRVGFVNQVVKEQAADADFLRGSPDLRRP